MNLSKSGRSYPQILSLLSKVISGQVQAEGADLDILIEAAKKEGVVYPLFRRLPADVHSRFKDFYYSYVAQGAHDRQVIETVLRGLDNEGIEALVLKGISVDSLIYPDDFYRPRADLDIFITLADQPRFEKAISRLGYRPYAESRFYPIPESIASSMCINKDGSLPLHVHFRVFNNAYLLISDDPERLEKIALAEVTSLASFNRIKHFSIEMQLVFLCEHALKHSYDELILLYEIDQLIRCVKGLNWDKVLVLAGSLDFSPFLYTSLVLCSKIFSTTIPQQALDTLRPIGMTRKEKAFIKDVLSFRRRSYLSFPVYLAQQKGFFKKMSFLVHTAFPPGFAFGDHLRRIYRRARDPWN
jgi:hypothetical protein